MSQQLKKDGRRVITDWSRNTFRIQESTLFGIELPLICRKFIDTEIFQRMRFIKQTGLANFVYPAAEHSRFIHSLGVASLAFHVMRQFQVRYGDEVVSKNDVLAVTL